MVPPFLSLEVTLNFRESGGTRVAIYCQISAACDEASMEERDAA
jgi:hypothetical protein